MEEHNVGAVVITEDRRSVGMITDRDLALALGARGGSPQAPARQVMSRRVHSIPEGMGAFAATGLIWGRRVRHLREEELCHGNTTVALEDAGTAGNPV